MARSYLSYTAALVFTLAVASGIIVSSGPGAFAGEASPSFDTSFIAIDLVDVTVPEVRGVEPSPFILWRNIVADQYLIRIVTLHHLTGLQLGNRLDIALPAGLPAAILWSSQIPLFPGRGVEPVPFIVYDDFTVCAFPLSYAADGTPSAGEIFIQQIAIGPVPNEHATCLAELPGHLIFDEMPRLLIGTDLGNVIAVVYVTGAGLLMYDILPVSDEPIRDIEAIPQYEYVTLGMLAGSSIFGYVYDPPIPGAPKAARSWLQFTLSDPQLASATDFDVFGITDQALTNPDTTVRLVIATGTDELGLAGISSQISGYMPLSIANVPGSRAVSRIAAGSLLMLAADSGGVFYDPGYDPGSGSSGCEVNITDDVADACGYTCGDANGDDAVNIADAVYLINYIFKDGPPPDPLCVADSDGDLAVNIADAVYLINYIFKNGPPPVEPCCP